MSRFVLLTGLLIACAPDGADAPTTVTTLPSTPTATDTGTTTTPTNNTTTTTSTPFTTSFDIGPNDAIAAIGCALLGGSQTSITAVDDQGMAGQVVVQPSDVQSWMVSLPATDQGFFTIEIGDWDTTQAFFAYVENDYGVWVPDGDIQGDRMLNGACPNDGITDQRVFYDHWTPVIARFEPVGPRDAFFAVVQESP